MSDWLTDRFYSVPETGVKFTASDSALQGVFDRCEELCLANIAEFGDKTVLKEGAKYNGVWLETQPMGGEMYASRNARVALNNHLIFMEYQRRDGRMPGMITCKKPWDGVAPHFDWMQGDFFSRSALRMYYWLGEDKKYLSLLESALRDFDGYLWKYRDSDGDGCLESWCMWDTGDDNNTRYLIERVHAVNNGAWSGETPPDNSSGLPFESAEYMAYSYSMRSVLAEIARLTGADDADVRLAEAEKVRKRFAEYLWDAGRGAAYDRDRNDRMMYALTLENLKCMYHGIFTQEMADEFVERHLMRRSEFFTGLPLPNIAANDPLYYVSAAQNNCGDKLDLLRPYMAGDMLDNSWSGAVEGLSVQRSLDALCNYGHFAEATLIGRSWTANLARCGKYVQQYDPSDGAPLGKMEGYGPTLLSALEYIAYLYGVDYVSGRLVWSADSDGGDTVYTQRIAGDEYTLTREGGEARAEKNGELLFTVTNGIRVTTATDGALLSVACITDVPVDMTLRGGALTFRAALQPNQVYRMSGGALVLADSAPFFAPRD